MPKHIKILKLNKKLNEQMRACNDALQNVVRQEILEAIFNVPTIYVESKVIDLAVAEMYVSGYSTKQICEELNLNRWSVYTRYHRAKALIAPSLSLTAKKFLNRKFSHF